MDKKEWKKKKSRHNGCDCRGRRHGNPKIGKGPCRITNPYREAVMQRKEWRKLCRDWLLEDLVAETSG